MSFDTAPYVLSVSPDGRKLAFVGNERPGASQLWVRSLDSEAAQPLPGTTNPAHPIWSPDSQFLAFYADGKLKKIAASGGPAQTLANAPQGTNSYAAWSRDDVVLFMNENAIYRVPAAGGAATPVSTLDASRQETGHRFPCFLPDGRHFLYLALSSNTENNAIFVGSLDSRDRKLLLNATSNALYSPPGYVLFQRDGTLMAQAFDPERQELSGEAVPIAEDVQFNSATGRTAFAASENGVLAYRSGGAERVQLTWTDRDGRKLGQTGEPGYYRQIALSPDEKRLAVQRTGAQTLFSDLWLLDLSRGVFSRLTSDPGNDVDPVWAPDGAQIAFLADRKGKRDLYRINLSNGLEELLLGTEEIESPDDWSKDGQFIVYFSTPSGSGRKILVLPLSGDRKPKLVLDTPFRKDEPQLSPDGRWFAYMADESGGWEIYVQPFLAPGEKLRISNNGGGQPRWRKDGRELFYLALDGTMMSAPITAGATLSAGIPKGLFQTSITVLPTQDQFAVTGDGQRFLLALPLESSPPIAVVLNWTAGLKK